MLNVTTKNSRKTFYGEGKDDFEEKPMFGVVSDSEMLHIYIFWRHFYWVFPRKFSSKTDVFLVGGKVLFADEEKIGMN